MRTSIVRKGNSKEVRIPKPLLEESGLGSSVELKAKKGAITITAPTAVEKKALNDEYLLSLSGLSDWDKPEEDKAWAHLQ